MLMEHVKYPLKTPIDTLSACWHTLYRGWGEWRYQELLVQIFFFRNRNQANMSRPRVRLCELRKCRNSSLAKYTKFLHFVWNGWENFEMEKEPVNSVCWACNQNIFERERETWQLLGGSLSKRASFCRVCYCWVLRSLAAMKRNFTVLRANFFLLPPQNSILSSRREFNTNYFFRSLHSRISYNVYNMLLSISVASYHDYPCKNFTCRKMFNILNYFSIKMPTEGKREGSRPTPTLSRSIPCCAHIHHRRQLPFVVVSLISSDGMKWEFFFVKISFFSSSPPISFSFFYIFYHFHFHFIRAHTKWSNTARSVLL